MSSSSASVTSKPALDPTKMKDWEVAEAAEAFMKPVQQLADELGLAVDELIPMGWQLAKVEYIKAMKRVQKILKSASSISM